MDLSERRSLEAAAPVVAFSPHPLLLSKERELVYAHFLPGETILEYLRRTGLLERMAGQPFLLTLDGRRLPRSLWAVCRPKPGTLINLTALVRGGDGKKNPLATIAMIALVVYAPQLAGGLAGPGAAASTVAAYQAGIMVVGSMAINALFPPPRPDLARAQNLGGGDSPNYSIGGGSNRMRRYEPMPKIIGTHRVFPDFGAQPYTEFEGADQVGYYVADLGYNDCELTDWKIGETPIEEFEGVEMEVSGPDGKLSLFPGNVDTVAGVELTEALGFVSRTSSPDARSLAVEISGFLFALGVSGTESRQATVDIEYRLAGAGAWTPLSFVSDASPATSIVPGVARVPASQYTHGVRKAITGQPIHPQTSSPVWAGWLTVLSASSNTTPGDYWITMGTDGMRWQAKPGGPGFFTGAFIPLATVKQGGLLLLYNGDRTQSLLLEITPGEQVFQAAYAETTFASITVGSALQAGQFMLLSSSREPLRRTFKWHVAEGQYEVRVKKSTPDESNLRATSQIVWSSLRTYQPDEADYTGRLRVGLKVKASALANGVLQQLSCIARARCVPGIGATHLSLPGTAGNYASTPDSAAIPVGVDMDIRAKIALDDWTPAGYVTIIGQRNEVSVADSGWVFRVAVSTGQLELYWGNGPVFVVKTSTAAVGIADGSVKFVRVTLDVDNGAGGYDVKYYTSDDGESWVQLGATVTTAGAVSMNNSTQDLKIGAFNVGAQLFDGKIYYAEIRNGIDGPVVAKFDPFNAGARPGDTSFASETGEVWTINQAGSPKAELIDDPAERPVAHSSNPAWWYLDALRGKTINGRRVYGAGLADSRIDIDGLKAFAQWCDDEGLEFNGVFDRQQSLFELLSAIALQGRGTPTMQTGKHGVLWDAPDLPTTAVFGMHNIVAGSFEVEYATGDLADVIEVWFINPELGWQRDFVRALVPGATSQARVRRVEAFGCTSKAQAGQMANLYAAANAYRTRRYKWRSDWEQMICPRGDVALLGHDLLQLLSGRFAEGGSTTVLKLPRKVPLYAGGAWITIRKPDATFATYAIEPGAGESDTLTPSSPLPFDPWADGEGYKPWDYRWHYGPASTTGRKVKIESFKPVSERLVDVTAVDEDPAYYAAKDNPLATLPPPGFFGQVQLQSVQVTEDGVRTGTGYLAKVILAWEAIGDYGFADVKAAVNGAPMELVGAGVRGRSFSFNVQDFSEIAWEVTAWSSFGRQGKSSKLTGTHSVNYAGQSPPSDITDFFLDGHTFRWSRAPEVDVVGSRIRYHFGENRNIADANELHAGLLASSPATFEVLPAGLVTFFITEVDAAGLESTTPAIIVKDLGDPDLANVVESVDFDALSYPGTLTGGTLTAGDLEADGTTDFYSADGGAFYGADAEPFYEDEVYEEMVYVTEIFYFSAAWVGSSMTLEHALEGEGVFIEYRQTNDGTFYGADGDDFYGADGESFYGADGEWRPWPGTVTYAGGDVQLRVTTSAGPIRGAVRELRMVIDVPDVVEELENVAIPQGGARLSLTKDFDYIKTVQLTLQDDGGGAVTARYLDKDPALGPLVECFDASQASIAGILDATITGR